MCGRYTITVTLEELIAKYFIREHPLIQYAPRYNAAPMQHIAAVIHDGTQNKLGELRWGLLPSWSKEDKNAAKLINARSETLLEKASFKGLVASRRCVIPADGFYDWKVQEGGKQPMRITMRDGKLFSMAALYDIWTGPDGGRISTCTIITTAPNTLMKDIHDRMPVILGCGRGGAVAGAQQPEYSRPDEAAAALRCGANAGLSRLRSRGRCQE